VNIMKHCRAVGVAGLALLATVASAGLPPITDPPTGEYRYGKFVWADLVTTDVAAARRFYGGLFGWAFAQIGTGRGSYTLAYQAGEPVAGMAEREPVPNQVRQSAWLALMSVSDVAAAARQVEEKGGRVLIPARQVDGRGDMAFVADPDGAPFFLVHSVSGDPADFLAGPGEWIWSMYQSPDATRAAAFYQDLAGYDVVADDRFPDTPHFFLVAQGFARASLAEIPAERSGLRPDWLHFVRVRDLRASLARVVELGGRLVVESSPELFDGRIAVIVDSVGAPLGLMEWHGDEEGER
jgi:predicted enzyme related to lactoylglutathione lyase